MNSNLKLAVLTHCPSDDPASSQPPGDHLELIICDVDALQSAAADQTRRPLALPHQRPSCRVRASRTFVDHRENRAITEELATRYEGTVTEGMDPFFSVVVFQLATAERILPEYFLRPMDRSLRASLH